MPTWGGVRLTNGSGGQLDPEVGWKLLTETEDIISVISSDKRQLFMNSAFHRILGYPERPANFPADFVHPDDRPRLESAFAELIAGAATTSIEYRVRHADGSWRWVEATGRNRLNDPQIRGVVAVTRDITDRKRLEEQLTRMAFHDELTGLANRALFDDRMAFALADLRRNKGAVVVFFIDLDGFKAVNDRLGHEAGDAVLVAMARQLGGAVRPGDTVGRWGGDEFVVLCPMAASDLPASSVADEMSKRLLTAVEQPIRFDSEEVAVSASIGWAATTSPDMGASELIREADQAAYRVKQDRRLSAVVPACEEH